MMRLSVLIAAFVAVLAASFASHAVVIFNATLTTSQEPSIIGPTTSGGAARPIPSGTASFILNDAQNALTFLATVFNIDIGGSQTPADTNDNLVAAHIHAGLTTVPTAPVVWGFFGAPFNDLNSPTPTGPLWDCTPFTTGVVGGTCAGTWDLTEGNGVVSPGVPVTLANQLPNILAGRSYINFHTTQNPGGEIRGALVIPEPTSLALFGIGALALFGFGLRRRLAPTF